MTSRLSRRLAHVTKSVESGMTTAEYAVGTLAACSQPTSQSPFGKQPSG
ncbi:DUF4244 domain-containing protein [Knoellia aerolata]|nr:DUF4244 domain-containing protein [Knoellia aerolata]